MDAGGCELFDVTLASVLLDGALRIGEAQSLLWQDVSFEPDGTARITIRRSKTDAQGEGATVAVTARTARYLQRMRRYNNTDYYRPATGYVFEHERASFWPAERSVPLSTDRLRMRLRRAGEKVGVGGLSGHSGRVGFARRLAEKNAPVTTIMTHGRWAKPETVAGYIRGRAASEVLGYLD